jgi:membrane-bound lytic murein transglycosylase F
MDFFKYSYKPILFIAVIVGAFSCTKSKNSADDLPIIPAYQLMEVVDKDLAAIQAEGKIRAIVENNSTSYFIYKGQPMGFEYELLRKMAAQLGLKLEVVAEKDIERAFERLNAGEVDIIAQKLSITKERRKWVQFTDPMYQVQQVLVQRKPENWREMKQHEIERSLIRNPIDLAGKSIHVRKGSAFIQRLRNLSEEIGQDINIIEDLSDADTEELIKKVAEYEIDFTVADDDVAQVSASYFPNLDVGTTISFPQQIGWAVRRNADSLAMVLNQWIAYERSSPDFYVIYNRYFKSPKGSVIRARSEFGSISGNSISIYDPLIKKYANEIAWDWRLLAALIFQESRFDPQAVSWAGATGLMQLMPSVASEFGATNPTDPEQSIMAGTRYLAWLMNYWENRPLADPDTRVKFILASYNVGPGHVEDAIRLTEKYGENPQKWDDEVEKYLTLKSLPKYFNDAVVQFGYCRGTETSAYVEQVLYRYQQYKLFFPETVSVDGLVMNKYDKKTQFLADIQFAFP